MYKILLSVFIWIAQPYAALAHTDHSKDPSAYVSEKVSIDGRVNNTLSLSVEDLAKFPKQTVQEVKIAGHNGPAEVAKYQGVLLTDLLSEAKMTSLHRHDYRKSAIIAKATDGYAVVFSWSELFNSVIGPGVMVVYLKNGQPLDKHMGKIALISAEDTATGPRFVKWLNQITVVKLAD